MGDGGGDSSRADSNNSFLRSDTVSDSDGGSKSKLVLDMVSNYNPPEENAEYLAGMLHDTLPADKQEKNIGAWETEWSHDFLELINNGNNPERIASVIKALPRLKTFKYVHRASYFCEHFDEIYKLAKKAKLL